MRKLSGGAGGVAYTGTIQGDRIELQRAAPGPGGRGGGGQQAAAGGARPAIGPPPDGSGPSNFGTIAALTGRSSNGGPGDGRGMAAQQPIVLRRTQR
jgi:hypothetical protein